jgi:hypothetical protein
MSQNCLNNIVVFPYALGPTEGSIDFYYSARTSGCMKMSTNPSRLDGEKISVPLRRLSSYVNKPVDLLKLDVEGAEYSILSELAESGKLRLVRRIHLEYHHHTDVAHDNLSAFLAVLEQHGFGYQIAAKSATTWPAAATFQDVSIFCYRKQGVQEEDDMELPVSSPVSLAISQVRGSGAVKW